MKKTDIISMSVRNLWRRKLRTGLTVLGVVIGTSSIVLMLSIGLAMEKNMEDQFAQMSDLTLIHIWGQGGGDSAQKMDDSTLKDLEQIPNVVRAVPMLNDIQIYLNVGKYRTPYTYYDVAVMDPADIEAMGYKVQTGRTILEDEEDCILMGYDVLREFTKNGKMPDFTSMPEPIEFDMESDILTLQVIEYDYETGKPILENQEGKRIKTPNEFDVKVVGMFSETDMQLARKVIITRSLYNKIKKEQISYRKNIGMYSEEEESLYQDIGYNEIIVKVNDRHNVIDTLDAIKELGYNGYNDMEYLEHAKEQAATKRMALGGIGVVSFIVAAIGIANTMMMSIYERTREIGVMKVIGARLSDIKNMFLMEAFIIGLVGGISGAVISKIISMILNYSASDIAEILGMHGSSSVSLVPYWLLLSSVVFSTLVGVLSGYFPAIKAMKLSALSAIKTE